jgi:glucose/arabinose dehydrogenase
MCCRLPRRVPQATSANPKEVRRIMTLGLPFTTHHGGQILFGPSDGYMYFAMGDGGSVGDPWNFAQNKKSILGKIIRIDVNTMPSKFTRFTKLHQVNTTKFNDQIFAKKIITKFVQERDL